MREEIKELWTRGLHKQSTVDDVLEKRGVKPDKRGKKRKLCPGVGKMENWGSRTRCGRG